MQARAIARFQRIAPRKARIVVDLVRGKSVEETRGILKFSTRDASEVVEKVVNSAAANAENLHDIKSDELFIKEIFVDEGPTMKRIQPRAQGRANRINKRTCHITVVVATKEA
jgi:large subunit ribosomal protein L22